MSKITIRMKLSVWMMYIVVMLLSSFLPTASYAATPASTASLAINGGGGAQSDGSDGIKLTFNLFNSGEQLRYKSRDFYYWNGDVSFFLSIGGTLYTGFNGSDASLTVSEAAKFTDLTISGLTGTASTTGGVGVGSGSAVLTYSVVHGGRTYIVRRTITYVHPISQYIDEYNITIPNGNTSEVKFYKGGDTRPYDADTAITAYFDTPVRNVQNIDTVSGHVLGIKEAYDPAGTVMFDGAKSGTYYTSYDAMVLGGDIGYGAESTPANGDPLDVGLVIQQDLGSTPGTYDIDNITYIEDSQAVKLEVTWADAIVSSLGRVQISLLNNLTTTQNGLGFELALPVGLVTGTVFNECGGSATASSGIITVSGVSLAAMQNCLIEVDVGSSTATTYTIGSSDISSLVGSNLVNAVTDQSITFTYASPTFTLTPTLTLSPTFTLTPSLTTSPTLTRTPSLTPTETYTRTPSPTFTQTLTPSLTRTLSPTLTPSLTRTLSPTFTPSITLTPSLTRTLSPTFTPTFTLTPSLTLTPSMTSTINPIAVKDIAIGSSFAIAVTRNGNLLTWGDSRGSQTSIPGFLRGLIVKDVEAGINWSLVLLEDGRLFGWGKNDFGQLDIPSTARSDIREISAFYGHVVAVKTNGTVVSWGRNNTGQTSVPKELKNVKSISAGYAHSLALRANGTVVGWGSASTVKPSFVSSLRNIVQVSAGFDHSLALTNDGRVICWISQTARNVGQCRATEQLTRVIAISAGRQFSVALTSDGKVHAWGVNSFGQTDINQISDDVTHVEAGYINSAVAYANGKLQIFGSSAYGMLNTRTPTSTGLITPSPARATWTPEPPTFTPRAIGTRTPIR